MALLPVSPVSVLLDPTRYTSDHSRSVSNDQTDKQVRDLAFEYAPYAAEEAWAEEVAQAEPGPPAAEDSSSIPIGTDPTVSYAGLTEIDNPAEPATNGVSSHIDTPNVPDAPNIDAGAANAAAGTNWDAKHSVTGEDWVEVTRDPAETDTGNTATPAAMTNNTQSWADQVDQMPQPAYTQPPAKGGDGFHEVKHHRGGRGRGGQGEHRGGNRGARGFRGERGEGGGRGRGANRGDRGAGGGDGERRGRGRGGNRGGNRGRGADAVQ